MKCYNCNSKKLQYDREKDCYICLNCGHGFPKQYFFISHSHLDIEKVRVIRNTIEETFFYEPILFFLKCLSDDDEIKDLIEREIYERIWFVYCKSKNAENSKYVKAEREYIDKLVRRGYDKKILEIDLDRFQIWDNRCRADLRRQISYQIRKTKIFLSYAYRDKRIADVLYRRFIGEGYSVWRDVGLQVEDDWGASAKNSIRRHSYKDGVILALCTEASVHSRAFMQELEWAMENDAMIVPVAVRYGEGDKLLELPAFLRERAYVTLDAERPEESLKDVLEHIKKL